MSKSKELAKTDSAQFAIMKPENRDIIKTMRQNLGTEKISAGDLTMITVPTGGGTMWSVDTIEGEIQTKELVGIIPCTQVVRAYWKESFDDTGGGTPPDCFSNDSTIGTGDPGGDCYQCPLNEFGTKPKGRGKACQEYRLVFMTFQDEILPYVIKVPATSLKAATKYLYGLLSRNLPTYSVYTKLTLEKDKNADGIQYSKIVFSKVGTVEDVEAAAKYAEGIRPYLTQAASELAQGSISSDEHDASGLGSAEDAAA